ncbi:hypothetical protein [Candidatus Phytoplasma sp. AldY-WA1]|uniref:hypothetical protein n=1 Tax=Candidatus Phytoplasma sp. AldY-WA1 TaxID=2852100 RepID=UPI00254AE18B|nr:hypothetical protein [Candidatus Phytoplasma sp. AldY-WA1]
MKNLKLIKQLKNNDVKQENKNLEINLTPFELIKTVEPEPSDVLTNKSLIQYQDVEELDQLNQFHQYLGCGGVGPVKPVPPETPVIPATS